MLLSECSRLNSNNLRFNPNTISFFLANFSVKTYKLSALWRLFATILEKLTVVFAGRSMASAKITGKKIKSSQQVTFSVHR